MAASPGGGRGGDLRAALWPYFAVLAISAALLLWGDGGLVAVRVAEGLIVVVGAVGLAARGRESAALFGAPRLGLRTAAIALGGTAVAFGLAQLLMLAAGTLDQELAAAYRAQGLGLAVLLADGALLPALGEELVFRGLVLGGLQRLASPRNAILVSAFFFATIHLSPISFAHLFVMGLVLGWARVATGTLWPSIVLHAAYNAAVLLQAWLSAPGS